MGRLKDLHAQAQKNERKLANGKAPAHLLFWRNAKAYANAVPYELAAIHRAAVAADQGLSTFLAFIYL